MENSVFNLFQEQLIISYPYLNSYALNFRREGEEEYFLHLNHKEEPLLMVSWEIKKKIKDFAKLFSLKIVTVEDFAYSGTVTSW